MRLNTFIFIFFAGGFSTDVVCAQVRNDSAANSVSGAPKQTFNTLRTYSIVYVKEFEGKVSYSILNVQSRDIVLQGSLNQGGYVRFVNDNTIETFNVPSHVTNIIDSAIYKRTIFLERR
jgi:hypothetical protein